MRHLKARRSNTQRLKQDSDVLQLAGARKTLESRTTQDFLGNKICRCEPEHEALDGGVIPMWPHDVGRGTCQTRKGMTTIHSGALSPLIKAFYCNKWYPVRLGADGRTPFFSFDKQHAASHQGTQRRNFVFVHRSGTQVGN